VVKKGESLYDISEKSGVSLTDIIKINNLKNTNLEEGQFLKLNYIQDDRQKSSNANKAYTSRSKKDNSIRNIKIGPSMVETRNNDLINYLLYGGISFPSLNHSSNENYKTNGLADLRIGLDIGGGEASVKGGILLGIQNINSNLDHKEISSNVQLSYLTTDLFVKYELSSFIKSISIGGSFSHLLNQKQVLNGIETYNDKFSDNCVSLYAEITGQEKYIFNKYIAPYFFLRQGVSNVEASPDSGNEDTKISTLGLGFKLCL